MLIYRFFIYNNNVKWKEIYTIRMLSSVIKILVNKFIISINGLFSIILIMVVLSSNEYWYLLIFTLTALFVCNIKIKKEFL